VERAHKPAFIMFLVVCAANLVLLWLRIDLPPGWRWVDGLFLALAVTTTLLALGRRLPIQNVLTAAALIAGLSAAIVAVGAVSGVPFGPVRFSESPGGKLFETVPWSVPVMWVVIVINARGVARLIMRPWRKTNYYGFWVIGLTCALAVVLDLGLEPFAVFVKQHWIWQPSKSALSWYTAPWVNFLGWFVSTLGILVFATPWLINKQPVKRPMDYHPLVVWLLLNLCLVAGNATHQLWPAVAVGLAGNAVAAVFAIRGARW
jgi:uncharacterized membrane protein